MADALLHIRRPHSAALIYNLLLTDIWHRPSRRNDVECGDSGRPLALSVMSERSCLAISLRNAKNIISKCHIEAGLDPRTNIILRNVPNKMDFVIEP